MKSMNEGIRKTKLLRYVSFSNACEIVIKEIVVSVKNVNVNLLIINSYLLLQPHHPLHGVYAIGISRKPWLLAAS